METAKVLLLTIVTALIVTVAVQGILAALARRNIDPAARIAGFFSPPAAVGATEGET